MAVSEDRRLVGSINSSLESSVKAFVSDLTLCFSMYLTSEQLA